MEEGTDAPPEGAAEGAEEAAEDPETHEGPDDRMDWEDRASEDS